MRIKIRKIHVFLTSILLLLILTWSFPAQSNLMSLKIEQNRKSKPVKINRQPLSIEQKIADIKKELLNSPQDSLLYNNLGVFYFAQENYEEAYKNLRKAVELNPDSADFFFNLSKTTEFLDRPDEAMSYARKAIAIEESHPLANIQLCQLLLYSKQVKESVACFENSLNFVKFDAVMVSYYGAALLADGKSKKALEVLQEKNNLYANDASIQNLLGMAFFARKKFEKAVGYFNRALKLNPAYDEARFNLAIAQLNLKNKVGALSQYKILQNSNAELAKRLYKFLYSDKILFINKK